MEGFEPLLIPAKMPVCGVKSTCTRRWPAFPSSQRRLIECSLNKTSLCGYKLRPTLDAVLRIFTCRHAAHLPPPPIRIAYTSVAFLAASALTVRALAAQRSSPGLVLIKLLLPKGAPDDWRKGLHRAGHQSDEEPRLMQRARELIMKEACEPESGA